MLHSSFLGAQLDLVAASRANHLALIEVLKRLHRVHPLMARPVVVVLALSALNELLPFLYLNNCIKVTILILSPLLRHWLLLGHHVLLVVFVGVALSEQRILRLNRAPVAGNCHLR